MACGNNNVSRSYLSSQPRSPQPPSPGNGSGTKDQKAIPPVTFPKAKTEKEWYSKYNQRGEGEVEVLLDKHGRPTMGYPHVHIIHDEEKGEVRLHNTMAKKGHRDHIVLPGTPTGTEVNAAVNHLRSVLKRRARK